MTSTPAEQSIKAALSALRLGTFEAEIIGPPPLLAAALGLYAWNAQVSAAMLAPLHVCEVVIRNAVSEALEAVYGDQWPWSSVFETSLPNPKVGFSPRQELIRARHQQPSVGKVIAETKMVFWQSMFTGRFDARIWNPHLRAVMPHLDPAKTVQELRRLIHSDLDQLRGLRNRIAHHEPIFKRSLADDFARIRELVGFRCQATAAWMVQNQRALELIAAKPF